MLVYQRVHQGFPNHDQSTPIEKRGPFKQTCSDSLVFGYDDGTSRSNKFEWPFLWETLAAINQKILWGWFVPPTVVILWILYYWVYQIIVFDMFYSQSLFDKIST